MHVYSIQRECLHILAFIELAADVVLLATTYREVELATDVQV